MIEFSIRRFQAALDARGRRVGRVTFSLVSFFMAIALVVPVYAASTSSAIIPDYPVPNGHFFSQASGQGVSQGFSIVDDGSIQLYDEFVRLGGVDSLGYPSSQQFNLGGFVTQATQKELLQWRPESNRAVYINIFDIFSQRGLDPTLVQTRQIPPTADNSPDANLAWPQVVARHLAILNQNPSIRARYFADADPIADFGLPQGAGDFGSVFVIRCERAAFQQWRIGTTFANPGDVTQVNGGDIAKDLGVVPPTAALPTPSASVLIAPPGTMVRADAGSQSSARQAAASVRPSLVRIDVTLPGATGIASGIVIDQSGNILTNQHVVDGAQSIIVTLANGVALPARVIGVDIPNDLAVVRVASGSIGAGVKPATIVGGSKLVAGQSVIGIGFTPYFPSPPAVRLGVYQQTISVGINVLVSDTYILPGDSGGMLVDFNGNVVGINDEIRFTQQSQQPLVGFSIDAAQALKIGQALIQTAATTGGG